MQKMFLFLLLLIAPAPALAQLTLTVPKSAKSFAYFPHIVAGGGWQTTFTLSNPEKRGPVDVSVYFKGDDGEDLPLEVLQGRGPWNGVRYDELPALDTAEFTIGLPGTSSSEIFQMGWAQFQADDFIVASATYSFAPSGVPVYSVTVPATSATIEYFSAATPNLGLALGNIYNEDLTLTVTAESDSAGKRSTTIALPPGGHTAKILWELIPSLPRDFLGTLRVSADNDYFVGLALKHNGNGVYSSLPAGEAMRPANNHDLIVNLFDRIKAKAKLVEPDLDWDSVNLDISYRKEINAYGGWDGIQINMALAELLSDSESELAFAIAHEIGHVIQLRTNNEKLVDPNLELDADFMGLMLSLIAGYDPYAGAGTLAKLAMANGNTSLRTQYTQDLTRIADRTGRVHGSFSNRLTELFNAIQEMCQFPDLDAFCQEYRRKFHPHLPGNVLWDSSVGFVPN